MKYKRYCTDSFFPEHNLSIEIDESNHVDRDKEFEKIREDFVKDALIH